MKIKLNIQNIKTLNTKELPRAHSRLMYGQLAPPPPPPPMTIPLSGLRGCGPSLSVLFFKKFYNWVVNFKEKFTDCGIILLTKFLEWPFYISDKILIFRFFIFHFYGIIIVKTFISKLPKTDSDRRSAIISWTGSQLKRLMGVSPGFPNSSQNISWIVVPVNFHWNLHFLSIVWI